MGKPVVGEVVVLPFPQTNLQAGKRRPALIVADVGGNDLILCQITSQARSDGFSIPLTAADFEHGRLAVDSFIHQRTLRENHGWGVNQRRYAISIFHEDPRPPKGGRRPQDPEPRLRLARAVHIGICCTLAHDSTLSGLDGCFTNDPQGSSFLATLG